MKTEIKRLQEELDKLYLLMEQETSTFGMDILVNIVNIEIELEKYSNQ